MKDFVLIVEDDPDVREILHELLSHAGFSTRVAAHGREALQLLDDGASPSLILLDLMMPVMNGWDFLTLRQRDARLSAMPVVVLTAARDVEDLRNVEGLLRKPVDLDELLATVSRFASHA